MEIRVESAASLPLPEAIQVLGPIEAPRAVGVRVMLDCLKLIPLDPRPIRIDWLENAVDPSLPAPMILSTRPDREAEALPRFESDAHVRVVEATLDGVSVKIPVSGAVWMTDLPPGAEALVRDTQGRVLGCRLASGAVISALCLGSAMVRLLCEQYIDISHKDVSANPLFRLYYLMPEALRAFLRKRYLAKLDRKTEAEQRQGEFRCDYPLETAGWDLQQWLKRLLLSASPQLAQLGFWPGTYQAAVTLTHDIEPTEFAYTQGIRLLRQTIEETGGPTHTLCLVSKYAKKYLRGDPQLMTWLKTQNIVSHGYRHINKTHYPEERINKMVRISRRTLSRLFGKPLMGFRGPRLQRGEKIMRSLLSQGLLYSTSCIDSDRENTCSWGGGVGMIHPYFSPIPRANQLYQDALLEIPISAPDCVMPYFAGSSETELHEIHAKKLAAVRARGGLYNSIIHAGVFTMADAQLRMSLLKHMIVLVKQDPTCWLTSLDEVYGWWTQRHRCRIRMTVDGPLLDLSEVSASLDERETFRTRLKIQSASGALEKVGTSVDALLVSSAK